MTWRGSTGCTCCRASDGEPPVWASTSWPSPEHHIAGESRSSGVGECFATRSSSARCPSRSDTGSDSCIARVDEAVDADTVRELVTDALAADAQITSVNDERWTIT